MPWEHEVAGSTPATPTMLFDPEVVEGPGCDPGARRCESARTDQAITAHSMGSLHAWLISRRSGCNSSCADCRGAIAQLGERFDGIEEVAGSTPACSTAGRNVDWGYPVARGWLQGPSSNRKTLASHARNEGAIPSGSTVAIVALPGRSRMSSEISGSRWPCGPVP